MIGHVPAEADVACELVNETNTRFNPASLQACEPRFYSAAAAGARFQQIFIYGLKDFVKNGRSFFGMEFRHMFKNWS